MTDNALLADIGLLGDDHLTIDHRNPILFDHVTVAIFVEFLVALVHIFADWLPAERSRLLVSNRSIRSADFSFVNAKTMQVVVIIVVAFNAIVLVVVFQTLAGLGHWVIHQNIGEIVVSVKVEELGTFCIELENWIITNYVRIWYSLVNVLVKLIEQLFVFAALSELAQGEQPQHSQPYQLTAGHVTEP